MKRKLLSTLFIIVLISFGSKILSQNTFAYANSSIDLYTTPIITTDNNAAYSFYRFEFSETNTFSEHIIPNSPLSGRYAALINQNNITTLLETVQALQPGKTYYVRVKYGTVQNNWIGTSSSVSFNTSCGNSLVLPEYYWQMESVTCTLRVTDIIRDQALSAHNNINTIVTGQVGNCLREIPNVPTYRTSQTTCPTNQAIPAPFNTNKFSMEFLVKPSNKNYNGYFTVLSANNKALFQLSPYKMTVNMYYDPNQSLVPSSTSLTRTGQFEFGFGASSGPYSYSYLADGNWHHIALIYDATQQPYKIQIWIDGMLLQGAEFYSTNTDIIPANMYFPQRPSFNNSTGNVLDCDWDEFAIYNAVLNPEMINQHYRDMLRGNHYSTCTSLNSSMLAVSPPSVCPGLPTSDFAPGHPNYNTSGITQLQQFNRFPLPRFKANHTLKRNSSIADLNYLIINSSVSGNLFYNVNFNPPGYGFDYTQAEGINLQLAQKWNYYLHLSNSNYNADAGSNTNLPLTYVASKFLAQANNNPQLPASIHTMWPQVSTPLTYPNNVISNCYLNSNCSVLKSEGDAIATKLYTNCIQYLDGGQIGLILENNEVVNTCAEDYSVVPFPDRGQLMQNVISNYKTGLMDPNNYPSNYSQIQNAAFRYYQNTGFGNVSPSGNTCVFPNWAKTHIENEGSYATIDTYISGSVNDWVVGNRNLNPITNKGGGNRGIDQYLEGRKVEIENGQKLCNPFVSAGWHYEHWNARPAQYLAFLKALSVAGAEMFNVGYFNLTPFLSNGKPFDPRGYVYQFAMPSYAQAVTSRYESILRNGDLQSWYNGFYNSITPYRFTFGNKLVLVRKENGKYLINGSIMPTNTCGVGIPVEENLTVNLASSFANAPDEITFKIRKQGSTYIYDRTNPNNVLFYQIDKWHEDTHPYFWSTNFDFEAEVYDYISHSGVQIKTEVPANTPLGDFTNYTTFLRFPANNPLPYAEYYFEPRSNNTTATNRTYYIAVRARTSNPSGNSSLFVRRINSDKQFCVNSTDFKWYIYEINNSLATLNFNLDQQESVKIMSGDAFLEVDRFILSEIPFNFPSSDLAIFCSNSSRMSSGALGENFVNGAPNVICYPNPSEGVFNIDVDNTAIKYASVKVMSIDGKTIYFNEREKLYAGKCSLSLSSLQSGLYMADVNVNGYSTLIKLVKY